MNVEDATADPPFGARRHRVRWGAVPGQTAVSAAPDHARSVEDGRAVDQ
jgi:hypothetical protein